MKYRSRLSHIQNSISELTILKITALVPAHLRPQRPPLCLPQHHATSRMVLAERILLRRRIPRILIFPETGKSLKQFFKSKALTLYVPFVAAVLFYLFLDQPWEHKLNQWQYFPSFHAKHFRQFKLSLQLGNTLVHSLHVAIHGHNLRTRKSTSKAQKPSYSQLPACSSAQLCFGPMKHPYGLTDYSTSTC